MIKRKLAAFTTVVKKLEHEPVELKGNKELYDYAGMNPEAAEVMGWPDEHHAILLDKHQDENTEVKNLVHETVEQEDMKKGMSYHDAHVEALKAETTVKTPNQLVNKVNYIRNSHFGKIPSFRNYRIPQRHIIPTHRTKSGGLTRRSDR